MITQDLRKLLNDYYSSSYEHLEKIDNILRTKGVIFRVTGLHSPKKESNHTKMFLDDILFTNIRTGKAEFLKYFFDSQNLWQVQWINNYHQVFLQYETILDVAIVKENKWLQKSGGQECFVRFLKLNPLEMKHNYLYDKESCETRIKASILERVNAMMYSMGVWNTTNLDSAFLFLKEMGAKDLTKTQITVKDLPEIVENLDLPFEYKDIDIWEVIKTFFARYSRFLEDGKSLAIKYKIIKRISEWEKEQERIRSHQLKLLSRANL